MTCVYVLLVFIDMYICITCSILLTHISTLSWVVISMHDRMAFIFDYKRMHYPWNMPKNTGNTTCHLSIKSLTLRNLL